MKHKFLFLFSLLLLAAAGTAHAAAQGGGGLPWEAPLTTLSNSVTGPVAYGCSLVGLVGCGGVLIFAGGMINEFLRSVMFIVLVKFQQRYQMRHRNSRSVDAISRRSPRACRDRQADPHSGCAGLSGELAHAKPVEGTSVPGKTRASSWSTYVAYTSKPAN
jgi:type IV secretory pathway VirB2 component (pilin)